MRLLLATRTVGISPPSPLPIRFDRMLTAFPGTAHFSTELAQPQANNVIEKNYLQRRLYCKPLRSRTGAERHGESRHLVHNWRVA